LLEKVREARAASEEEDFYKQGREKALKLIQQQQFEQAADLLRNLLTLFPGDPILERDLRSVQSRCDGAPQAAAPDAPEVAVALESASLLVSSLSAAPAEAPSYFSPPVYSAEPIQAPAAGRRRLALTGAMGLLLLVSAGSAAWKYTRGRVPVEAPKRKLESIAHRESPVMAPVVPANVSVPPAATTGTPAPSPISTQGSQSPSGARPTRSEPAPARSEPKSEPAQPTKPFTLPPTGSREPQTQPATLPAPPGTAPTTPTGQVANLPANLNHPLTPAPPPPPPAASPSPAPDPAKSAAPAGSRPDGGQVADKAAATPAKSTVGGRVQEAQLLVSPQPVLPAIARQQRISGAVNIEATIDASGKVKGVKVLDGHPVLSGAAVNAVLKWRYRPATLNGQPIETTVTIRVLFSADRE
jgi:protein TonB